jgi:hypothetical protein
MLMPLAMPAMLRTIDMGVVYDDRRKALQRSSGWPGRSTAWPVIT